MISSPQLESSKYPPGYNDCIGLRQIFRFEAYLESQLPQNVEFYEAFMDTQLFNDFLERALRTNPDMSLSFFISSLDMLVSKQSFTEMLTYQQESVQQVLNLHQLNSQTYVFHDLVECFQRAVGSISNNEITAYWKQSSNQSVFHFKKEFTEVNLLLEIQKSTYIKNLIKRPSTTKKIKPSKKSEMQVNKQNILVTTANSQLASESRNQSHSIHAQQPMLSQVYFQKGPQKVSTPKGLPSEIKSMGNFLSEDDSKSTNSKELKNSQEESKSDTSSIKSFFKSTFEKIHSKLMTNKTESQPQTQNPTPIKEVSQIFNLSKLNISSLSGINVQSSKKEIGSSAADHLRL